MSNLRFRSVRSFISIVAAVGLLLPMSAVSVLAVATEWQQVGVDLDGEASGDSFGWRTGISSDGNTVIIGATRNDGTGTDAGHARVYRFDGSAWIQLGDDIDGEAAGDQSGFSVDMNNDGDTVVIGARRNDGNGSDSGHARIYQFDGADWIQLGTDINGERYGDNAGVGVAMNGEGNTVIVGSYFNDDGGYRSGSARVFTFDGLDWVQTGSDIDGESSGDWSGYQVAMSEDGDTVVTTSFFNDGINGTESGHARAYFFDGADWIQKGTDIDGEAAGDRSGGAVGMSADGNSIVVGAIFNDGTTGTDSGHARAYRFDGTDWVQRGSDIDGERAGDRTGYSVAMSADGNTVVTGAYVSDDNGTNAGHARVYQYVGSEWVQVGSDIDGEAAGDLAGISVAVNHNGTTVIVGASLNDAAGDNAGHARVYELVTINTPPSAHAGGPYSLAPGEQTDLDGSGSFDPDGDSLTETWTSDSGTINGNVFTAGSRGGTHEVCLTVDDGQATNTACSSVVVNTLTIVDANGPYLVATGEQIKLDASGTYDPDGAPWSIIWTSESGSIDDRIYTAGDTAGIYEVCLTAEDPYHTVTDCTTVVVYDADGGFVTGGGWIESPAGAYTPSIDDDPDVSGHANFGFFSKYQPGATIPTGSTEFQFAAGDLNFRSDSYDWLVVAGFNRAKFRGAGTVNGVSGYDFQLTVVDNGSEGDTFRIQLWDSATDVVLYDNHVGGGNEYGGTSIAGGGIVIHTN